MRRMQFMGDIRDLGAHRGFNYLKQVKAMKYRISNYQMSVSALKIPWDVLTLVEA